MSRRAVVVVAALLAALATPAVAAAARGTCEWRSPAHDAYQGDVPSAVDSYADLPKATRERLKARMQRLDYDDIVSIRRDSIDGNFRYEPALRGMHFGQGGLCRDVTRKTWTATHEERALAYCEDRQCVVVPMVCRNVSRIFRRPAVTAAAPTGQPVEPLVFDAPSAGVPAAPQAAGETPDVQPLASLPPPKASLPVPGSDSPPALAPLLPLNPNPPSGPVVTLPSLPPLPPTAPAVPEPGTALLWAAGLAAGGWWMRRRQALAALAPGKPRGGPPTEPSGEITVP